MKNLSWLLAGSLLLAVGCSEDDSKCVEAFGEVQTLRQQLEAQMGGNNQAPPLDQAAFVERCMQLPEEARQCAVLSYQSAHQEECAAHRDALQALNE